MHTSKLWMSVNTENLEFTYITRQRSLHSVSILKANHENAEIDTYYLWTLS